AASTRARSTRSGARSTSPASGSGRSRTSRSRSSSRWPRRRSFATSRSGARRLDGERRELPGAAVQQRLAPSSALCGPPMNAGMLELREALALVVRNEGSDLHLKVGSHPLVRVHGKLGPVEEFERLKAEDTERLLHEMLGNQARKVEEFETDNEVDFSYAIEGLARFRVNAFRQRGTVSIVARVIPFAVRTVAELGLPPVINELADEERGLIL